MVDESIYPKFGTTPVPTADRQPHKRGTHNSAVNAQEPKAAEPVLALE